VAPTILAMTVFWLVWKIIVPDVIKSSEGPEWLFESDSFQAFWQMWTSQSPLEVSPQLLVPRPLTFLSLGSVLLVSQALRIAGIEGSTGMILDLDREVKVAGVANLCAGLSGGIISSHSPGLTAFNMSAGSSDGRASILAAIFQLALWLSGLPARNLFPRYMLAGILMNLGSLMLVEWMWSSRARVGLGGLAIIYLQVACSAWFGLLPSIILGYVLTGVISKIRLINLSVLKYHVSGRSLTSTLRRSDPETLALDGRLEQIEAIGLEGHLSEGPVVKLAMYLQSYMKSNAAVRFLIIDFTSCHLFTPSACALLAKLDYQLSMVNVRVCYSNVEPDLLTCLGNFGLSTTKDSTFDTLQQAMHHCENKLLSLCSAAGLVQVAPPSVYDFRSALADLLQSGTDIVERLEPFGSWSLGKSGDVLTRQGQYEGMLHFCLPWRSTIRQLASDDLQSDADPCLITVHISGIICGIEGVLYHDYARMTFSVKRDSQMFSICKESFEKLTAQHPDISQRVQHAAALQTFRQCDYFRQNLCLAKGGGWHGARFDLQTANTSKQILRKSTALATPTKSLKSRRRYRRQ